MEYECRNCKNYKGDCGNHFVDQNGHINYEIPRESCYVNRVSPFCFEPSNEYKKELFKKDVEKILGEYTPEQIEAAMKLLKKQSEK